MSTKAKIFFIALLVLGFLTRFVYFGYPSQIVFDEIYFGSYASAYITGNYFFDIHPPLGKLLIAVAGEIGGYKPGFNFKSIDEPYPSGSNFISLRILPMVIGSLLPALIFLVCAELGLSLEASFFAGLLIAFENSMIVESRFILLNMFILFFGFLGILLFLKYRKKRTYLLFCISAFFLGCALSVKWTGVSFLGLAGLLFLRDSFKELRALKKEGQNVRPKIIEFLKKILIFIAIPAVFYISLMAVHFFLLPKSGAGDDFMTPQFQATLFGNGYSINPSISKSGFISKFLELSKYMYTVQQQAKLAYHPYASRWYTWPLMIRSIYYWNDVSSTAKIYLLGNPAVYWLSTLAVCILTLYIFFYFLLVYFFKNIFRKLFKPHILTVGLFLIVSYFANILPFTLITRSMFLYHYFPALVFACIILAFVIDKIPNYTYKISTITIISLIVVCCFLYFAPLTYGLPLSDSSFHSHMWLHSWI